jgi:hypothetical protein
LNVGWSRRRHAGKQIDRHAAIPHGAVNWAVGRLVLRREQGLDLVVRRVDRAGAAGFVGALAAIAPVRRASSALLPPRTSAVSAKEVPVEDLSPEVVGVAMRCP